jgi:5-methyltetrahydropteroyltriglutamate--homocysteine methyltransferase
MKRSTDRILTTHTGSLPRPRDLTTMLQALDAGNPPPAAAFEERVKHAVVDVVRHQVEAGVDIVNDGEQGKVGYSTYVRHRSRWLRRNEHRRDASRLGGLPGGGRAPRPFWSGVTASCNGPIDWKDRTAGPKDVANLGAALERS